VDPYAGNYVDPYAGNYVDPYAGNYVGRDRHGDGEGYGTYWGRHRPRQDTVSGSVASIDQFLAWPRRSGRRHGRTW